MYSFNQFEPYANRVIRSMSKPQQFPGLTFPGLELHQHSDRDVLSSRGVIDVLSWVWACRFRDGRKVKCRVMHPVKTRELSSCTAAKRVPVELSMRASRLDSDMDAESAIKREDAPAVGAVVKVCTLGFRRASRLGVPSVVQSKFFPRGWFDHDRLPSSLRVF